MRIWNRLNTFCFIRYAYFLTWCAHVNAIIWSYLYIIEHIAVADEFITSKNPDLRRLFIIKPWHPGRLKITDQKSGLRKPQWEPWSHAQNAYYRNLKWTFEDLLSCYCCAIRTKSTTIRQQVSQSAFAGKGSDVSELRSCAKRFGHWCHA